MDWSRQCTELATKVTGSKPIILPCMRLLESYGVCSQGEHEGRTKLKLSSMALVRERTIPTKRSPPVGEVSANFCGLRGFTWSAQRVPTAVNLYFLDRSRYLFYSSSSSVDLTRLSGPRSRPTTTQKICICSQKL
jgi:hypothetical protein